MEALRSVTDNTQTRAPKRRSEPARGVDASECTPAPTCPGLLPSLSQALMRRVMSFLPQKDVWSLVNCSREFRARASRSVSSMELSEAASASGAVMAGWFASSIPHATSLHATVADGLAISRLRDACLAHASLSRLQTLNLTLPRSRALLASGLNGMHPRSLAAATADGVEPGSTPKRPRPAARFAVTPYHTEPVEHSASSPVHPGRSEGVVSALSPSAPSWGSISKTAQSSHHTPTPASLVQDILSKCPELRSLRLCGVQPIDNGDRAAAPLIAPTRLRVLHSASALASADSAAMGSAHAIASADSAVMDSTHAIASADSAATSSIPVGLRLHLDEDDDEEDDDEEDDDEEDDDDAVPTTSVIARGLPRALGQPLSRPDTAGVGGIVLSELVGAPHLRLLDLERCQLGTSGAEMLALLLQPSGVGPDWSPAPAPASAAAASSSSSSSDADADAAAAAMDAATRCASPVWPLLSPPRQSPLFLHALQELRLRSCGLSADSVPILPPSVRLQVLDLSWNCLGPLGCERLGATLVMQTGLKQLYLADCGMTSSHLVACLLPLITRVWAVLKDALSTRAASTMPVQSGSAGSGVGLLSPVPPVMLSDALHLGQLDYVEERKAMLALLAHIPWATERAQTVTDEQVCLRARLSSCMADAVDLVRLAGEDIESAFARAQYVGYCHAVDEERVFGEMFGRTQSATGNPFHIAPIAAGGVGASKPEQPVVQWASKLPTTFRDIASRALPCCLPLSRWHSIPASALRPAVLRRAHSVFCGDTGAVTELGCSQLEVVELGGNICDNASAIAFLSLLLACPALRHLGVDEWEARRVLERVVTVCWGVEVLSRVRLRPIET